MQTKAFFLKKKLLWKCVEQNLVNLIVLITKLKCMKLEEKRFLWILSNRVRNFESSWRDFYTTYSVFLPLPTISC